MKLKLKPLSALQMYKIRLTISNEFGDLGLKVLALMLKKPDLDAVVSGSGVDRSKVIEILNRLAELGALEPFGSKPAKSQPEAKPVNKPAPVKKVKPSKSLDSLRFSLKAIGTLKRFRTQKQLFKKYSSKGLAVYDVLKGRADVPLDEIVSKTGFDKDFVIDVLKFMTSQGMLEGISPEDLEVPVEAPVEEAEPEQVEAPVEPEEVKPTSVEESEPSVAPSEEDEVPESSEEISAVEEESELTPEVEAVAESEEIESSPVEESPPDVSDVESVPEEIESSPAEESQPEVSEIEPTPVPEEAEPSSVGELESAPVEAEASQDEVTSEPVAPSTAKVSSGAEYKAKPLNMHDKFKIQQDLLSKFGGDGLKVFSLLTLPSTIDHLVELSGLEKDRIEEIVRYLVSEGVVESKGGAPIEGSSISEGPKPVEERAQPAEEVSELSSETPPEEELNPEEEISPELEQMTEESPEEISTEEPKPSAEIEPEVVETNVSEEDVSIQPEDEELKPVGDLEDVEPPEDLEIEHESSEVMPSEEMEELAPSENPLDQESEGEGPEVESEPFEGEEELLEESAEESDLVPEDESEEVIYKNFGETGLKVYRAIDGVKTTEEIMEDLGVSEEYIVKFFDFLEKHGIIRLDYQEGASSEDDEFSYYESSSDKLGMVPLAEKISKAKREIIINNLVPIDVPIKKPLSLPARLSLEAKLMAKFGSRGVRVLNLIDSSKDIIQISLDTGIPLGDLDEILYSIGNSGGCEFATLSEDEVKDRYGEIGYRLYKEYGREGVLMYELVGRSKSLKDMVKFVGVDAHKAVDMLLKINRLLDLSDISKEELEEELGIA